MKRIPLLIITSLFFTVTFNLPGTCVAQAQSIKLEISGADDIRATLDKIENKPVTVILNSDKELTGRVYNVTDKLVHLTDLQGKEFFDAIIKIDSIQAIVIKAK
jgi:hypothetical protein